MARHGCISKRVRARAYHLLCSTNVSVRKVASLCKISPTSCVKTKRTYFRRQGQKEKQKGGRPRKLSNRDKRALTRALLWLRENERRCTIKRVMEQVGFTEAHLSERSVSRYLNSQAKGTFLFKLERKDL